MEPRSVAKSVALMLLASTVILECYSEEQSQSQNNIASDQSPTYKIADYIVKSLEAFRKYMIEGNQEIQLPVLDPVPMESFNYSLINTAIGFKMEMSLENPSITGLSRYELTNVSVAPNAEGHDLKMTILFPQIEVKGLYDAGGTVFGFFSMSGNGDFEIVGASQVLSSVAALKVINDTYFIEDINSSFSGGRVKARFNDSTNFARGDFTGLFSEMLSAMGNQIFNNRLKPVVTAAMNEFTKDWLNGAFGAVTINDFYPANPPTQARVMSEAVSAVVH